MRPLRGCRMRLAIFTTIDAGRCRVMCHTHPLAHTGNGNAPRKLMYAGRMPIIHFNDTHAEIMNVSLRLDSNKQLQLRTMFKENRMQSFSYIREYIVYPE